MKRSMQHSVPQALMKRMCRLSDIAYDTRIAYLRSIQKE